MKHDKYKPFPAVVLPDRTWPDKRIEKAPRWCSVDLRDGNQALPHPMTPSQKLEMFRMLVRIGFKEIEVGFPSASEADYDFVRLLIEHGHIPEDVTIQVITQAREHLIERTCKSLTGARRATIKMLSVTSALQRRVVFCMNQQQVTDMAVEGTTLVRQYSKQYLSGTDVSFVFALESFMGTEPSYAVAIAEAAAVAWGLERGVIISLPSTVEIETPNAWADRVEWFCRHFAYRDKAVISLHCHNDRGTGITATEFGILAGADRVDGTLFGSGERTGNADLVTLALNLSAQGINPHLDLSHLDGIRATYERCTGMQVPPRHPYAGNAAFTAYSCMHRHIMPSHEHAPNGLHESAKQ